MASAIAVGVSALINFVVELTNFGNGVNSAFGGLLAYLAVLPVAAVAAWWVHAERSRPAGRGGGGRGALSGAGSRRANAVPPAGEAG